MPTIYLIEPQWTNHKFLNQKIYDELLSNKYRIIIKDLNNKNKSHGVFRFWMIFTAHLKGLKECSEGDYLFFLSYHTYIMFIALSFIGFKKKNIYVIEHSNIDRLGSGFLYDFIYKKMNKNLISLCFEKYIRDYTENEYLRTAVYIPHPIKVNEDNSISFNREYSPLCIFSPSGQISERTKKYLASLNLDFKIYLKGKNEKLGHLIIKNFFDDYEKIFKEAKVILFDHNYQYRVSNVIYEAIQLNKIILSRRCLFSSHISKTYDNIYLYDDIESIKADDIKALMKRDYNLTSYQSDKNLLFSNKLHELFI